MTECRRCRIIRGRAEAEVHRLTRKLIRYADHPTNRDYYADQLDKARAILDRLLPCNHDTDDSNTITRIGKRAAMTTAERTDIIRRYRDGQTIQAIAESVGWSRHKIATVLDEADARGPGARAPQVIPFKPQRRTQAQIAAEIEAWTAANQKARESYNRKGRA